MPLSYTWFITTASIPAGFELVCDYAVKHPIRGEGGALVRNKKTGIYAMYICNYIVTCPQRWAANNPEPFSWLTPTENPKM